MTGSKHTKVLNRKVINPSDSFGGLPVVEAKTPLRLQPMPCDLESSSVKDPTCCVFARAASRQYGATKVLFWKTTAYVDLVGRDGVRRVERYLVPLETRKLIESFDKGEPIEIGRAFVLRPAGATQTMKAIAETSRVRKATPEGAIVHQAIAAVQNVRRLEARLSAEREAVRELATTEKPQSPKLTLARQRVRSTGVTLIEAKNTAVKKRKEAVKVSPGLGKRALNYSAIPKKFDMAVRNGKADYHFKKAA